MKNLFIVVLCFCTAEIVQAQYLPIVEEGKVWTYQHSYPFQKEGEEWPKLYSYDYVQGDTIIDGHQCKKVYSKSDLEAGHIFYEGSIYEDDGKIYYYANAENYFSGMLLYDFSAGIGSRVPIKDGSLEALVVSTFTVSIYGVERRIFKILSVPAGTPIEDDNETFDTYWIEGIGGSQGLFSSTKVSGNAAFETCKVFDNVVFDYDYFFNKIITSVKSQMIDNVDVSNAYYNLQGHQIQAPSRGLFIHNGRKFLK